MTQVVFSGSSGTIPNLNQNFTQLYALRELISDASYTAATPKLSVTSGGAWSIPAPTAGVAFTATGFAGSKAGQFSAQSNNQVADFNSDTTSPYVSLSRSGVRKAYLNSDSVAGLLLVQEENLPTIFYSNNLQRLSITASGDVLAIATGIGYGTGAGGTVTQATSKSTGVTLNKATGTITMNAASLAATTSVSFVLTNSLIAATDVVNVAIKSGATLASYFTQVDATAAGSCTITLRNYTGGALAEAVVLSFALLKGVAA